jgi:hypothetical protein
MNQNKKESCVSVKVTYKFKNPPKDAGAVITAESYEFGADKPAELWILIMGYIWQLIKFYMNCFPNDIDKVNQQIQKAATELSKVYVEKKGAKP